MAGLTHTMELLIEFEPVVKLVCTATDCVFNLMNSANLPERKEAACNLKQITVGDEGQCKNYLSFKEKQ